MWRRGLDGIDIEAAARALSALGGFVWLDSAQAGGSRGRFSYLCAAPVTRLEVLGGRVLLDGEAIETDALEAMRRLARAPVGRLQGGPPFQGGLVGCAAYGFCETTVPGFRSRHVARGPEAAFGLYDTVLAFNPKTRRADLVSAGLAAPGAAPDASLARRKLDMLAEILAAPPAPACAPALDWAPLATRADYLDGVARIQNYIRAGDIYQANFAEAYRADWPARGDPLALYLRLRRANPAPFAAYAELGERTVFSTSPERLFALSSDGLAETRPIKGTIRRSDDPEEDAALRAALAASEKDRAENVMIVDLLRNDFSRVCRPHSVRAPEICSVETYASLHHLTSSVEGRLRSGRDAFDLLGAVFPGGSITGAPKRRAMEVIDELERTARGAFCGSLGYVGFDGRADFNILIRTVDLVDGAAWLHGGAGITLASDPAREYDETRLKLQRILTAAAAEKEAV